MKIRSIELTNFRKFVGTVRVESIGDNVNVLVGRNELGKSTLLQAINAVIFERARSTASHVKAFRHFVNQTVPEVKLTFDIDGQSWVIHKRFAGQSGKAILTCIGGAVYEDEAAEAELQRLLGFTGGRGGGEPGIWGTLWVQQGQSLGDLALNEQAQHTIQGCLEAQVGLVTGGARGQRLPKAVREALGALENQRGPRGAFKDTIDQLAALETEIEQMEGKAKTVSDDLAKLATSRRELKAAQTEWDETAYQTELQGERGKRDAAATLAAEMTSARAAAKLARERADVTEKSLADRRRTIGELASFETEKVTIQEGVTDARAARDAAKTALETAERSLADLRAEARANSDTIRRLDRIRDAITLNTEIGLHQETLDQAETLEANILRLTEAIGAIAANDERVARIESASTELAAAEAATNAVSTTVSFTLQADARTRVRVNGRTLDPDETAIALLQPTTIAIDGIGAIAVEPQIKELSALLQRRQDAQDNLANALRAAGAEDLAAARTLAARRREHERGLAEHRNQLVRLAPGNSQKKLPAGVNALKTHLGTLRGRLKSELQALKLETLPPSEALGTDLATARSEGERLAATIANQEAALAGPKATLTEAEVHLNKHEHRLTELDTKIGTRASDLAAARQTRADDALAEDAERLAREAETKEQVLAEHEKTQSESVEAIEARIKRLEATAANRQRAIITLNTEITRLTALVQAQEGLGIEEQILSQQAERDRLRESVRAYEQDAAVLRLLSETLETAEREAKTLYLAPVVQRVQPYLKMLLPESDLIFDEDLGISGLQRDGHTEDYGVLSGGTQEQLAVLSRIAFAELLLAQNRPAAVILDDALAFSDDDRIESMFDVLMRAGDNVQIIVLTCRKKLFARLGAAPLELRKVG
ncbi:MAG: AAA family ATPase [Proteobacteria bacterium]|nr:AAA family ATPase [Pseudomonadota bacterium]